MEPTVFVGIDVSKLKLDVCVLDCQGALGSFTVTNNPKGFAQLLGQTQKRLGKAQFCMEATGSYHFGIGFFLLDKAQLVSVENPATVKFYGQSISALQKTDKADAKVLARYCRERRPATWRLNEPKIRELLFLSKRIDDLNQLSNQESNRLENDSLPELVVRGIKENLTNFKAEIATMLREIEKTLAECETLTRTYQLLKSIPGIGVRAAVGFMASFAI